MRIILITIVLIAALVVGLFSCSSSIDEKDKPMAETSSQHQNEAVTLPTFNMTDANGNTINLSSFKGKKVFVNLWATWCPPCGAEIPSIEALASKVGDDGAVFIMLSLDEDFETVKKFAKAQNLKIPFYYPAERLPELLNVDGIPATFIFNENGDLVKQNNGAEDYDTGFYIDLLGPKP